MKYLKKLGLTIAFLLTTIPAHSAMVATPELVITPDQAQLIDALQSQQVQKQLMAMGVDPAAASDRVKQMTQSEIASLQGKIDQLPAGAGIGITNLLLIIIILILLL